MLREMKNVIVVSLVAVAVLCGTGAAGQTVDELLRQLMDSSGQYRGSGPEEVHYIWSTVKLNAFPEPDHVEPGHVQLRVELSSTHDCGDITLELVDVQKLEYSGPRSWISNARTDNPEIYYLDLVIPAKDTSGLELVATGCGTRTDTLFCYFIPNGDSIDYGSYRTKFYLTSRLNYIPPRSYHILKPAMPDSTCLERATAASEQEEALLNEFRQMENEPLTEHSSQSITVNHVVYIRSRGERRFRKAVLVDPLTMQQMQSVGESLDRSIIGTREVLFNLREPSHEEVMRSLLGDALTATENPGYYKATLDPAMWNQLEQKGIVVSRGRERKDGATDDGGSSTNDESDPGRIQRNRSPSDESGDASLSPNQPTGGTGIISIGGVTNTWNDGGTIKLNPGSYQNTHTINFDWDFSGEVGGCVNYAPTNAFRMWSTDGAQWNYLQGDVSSAWNSFGFAQTFVNHFYWDYSSTSWLFENTGGVGPCRGYGSVAVLFGTVAIYYGLPGGYHDDLTSLEFQSRKVDEGRHICVDTASYVPAGAWGWWNAGCGAVIPDWNDATCWEIKEDVPPEFDAVGGLTYTKQPGQSSHYADHVRVELWDYDSGSDDDLLAAGYTNSYGIFDFSSLSNVDGDETGGQDIYALFYSETSSSVVGDSIVADQGLLRAVPNFVSTDTVPDLLTDWHVFGYKNAGTLSRFFYVADMLYDADLKWDSFRPGDPLGQTHALLKKITGSAGTIYSASGDIIMIADSAIAASGFPDTWDADIIAEEFGHRIAFTMGFLDSSLTATHSWTSIHSPELGAKEAFGDFWAAVCANNDTLYNIVANGDTVWRNLETGEHGQKGSHNTTVSTTNAYNRDCEGTIAGILWDLYDSNDDDYSGHSNWGDSLLSAQTPDDIWDSVQIGLGDILSVLADRNVNGHHPDNLEEIVLAWFQSPTPGQFKKVHDVWYEHGAYLYPDCCEGTVGDVDMSREPYPYSVDGADLTLMINSAFIDPHQPLPCWQEADIDSSGQPLPGYNDVDAVDVLKVVDYLFIYPTSTLPSCP